MAKKRRKTHPDVEFHVEPAGGRAGASVHISKTWADACEVAVIGGIIGNRMHIDVVVWSESGARWYGGSDAVEQYREDPEASVFERYELRVNAVGRVP
jgi:hypothetical protein